MLNTETVRKIMLDHRPQAEIAIAYGVCRDTVSLIKRPQMGGFRTLQGPPPRPRRVVPPALCAALAQRGEAA